MTKRPPRVSITDRTTQVVSADSTLPEPPAPRAAATAQATTSRVSTFLGHEEFTAARGAYLLAWERQEVHTFAQWITAALERFADLTPEVRGEALDKRGTGPGAAGSPRSLDVSDDALGAMRDAITKDHSTGRWPTTSAWVAAALLDAAAVEREAAGGTLPTPPARLPFRRSR